MNWKERIVSSPSVLVGKPVVKGARLSVDFILRLLAQGWTENQLFESYPQLKPEDLQAVFAFLQDCLADEEFIYLDRVS
jgi:uncharacterized protein (DUF433 family)